VTITEEDDENARHFHFDAGGVRSSMLLEGLKIAAGD
jgi:hypothetical protein